MGQYKPMVKMKTTEPSVELKLKTGGSATHKRMMQVAKGEGFKPMKKQTGGAIDALAREPMPTTPMGNPAAARAMATRRMAKKPSPMPRGIPAVGRPKPPPMMAPMASAPAPRMMKKGGESMAEHKAEMKKMSGTEAKLKKHASLPASKAHRGLKTGGVAMAQAGYKTGGVVQGNAGYKTGGVVNGQGGFKNGGKAVKKPSATGAKPDSGAPVAMPQGRKPPSRPVQITQLSGTFKTGGRAKKAIGGVC